MKLLALLIILPLAGCADYQSHVASRQVGVQGQFDKTTSTGSVGVTYGVTYR